MREVFRSPPVPAVEHASDGRKTPGMAFAIANVYEPGEAAPHAVAFPVTDWLRTSKLSADGSLPNSPPPTIVGPAPVHIPAAVLAALSPDSLLEIGWEIRYGDRK